MDESVFGGGHQVQGMQGCVLVDEVYHGLVHFRVVVSQREGSSSAEKVEVAGTFYVFNP